MLDSAATMRDGGSPPDSPRRRARRRGNLAFTLAALVVGSASCGPPSEPSPAAVAPDATSSSSPAAAPPVRRASLLALEEAERLAALGYTEFAEGEGSAEPDADARTGVVLLDRQRACPGYSLVSVIPLNVAELVDLDGRVLNRWSLDGGLWLARCALLPSGDVLVVGTRGDPADPVHYLARLSWTGEVRWLSDAPAHHDVELTPRGEVLALVSRPRPLPAVDASRDVQDNLLALFALDDGRPLGELSLADVLLDGPRPVDFQDDPLIHPRPADRAAVRAEGRTEGRLEGADWLHANSAQWMPWPALAGRSPLYDPANVLVSLRHQSLVAIVNWDRRELVWVWGRGELRHQHEATWLRSGNLLVFDNGDDERGWSRLVEVDPRQDRIVWQWIAPEPRAFYSRGQGTAQELPNGNVLVGFSAAGEAFELARDGTVVWRLLDPYRDGKGRRASLRIERYAPDVVEPLLERLGRRGG
jgi:hypothetical protein